MHYSVFQQNGDLFASDDAVAAERRAVAAWQRLVEAAGDMYGENLAFGVHRTGFSRHWKEELEKLRAGLEKLEKEREQARFSATSSVPRVAHTPVRHVAPADPLIIRASVAAEGGARDVTALVSVRGGEFERVAMKQAGAGRYQASIPHAAAEGELRYVIEVTDSAGRRAVFPPNGKTEPLVVHITADQQPPQARLEAAAAAAKPGQDLRIAARVTDASGVRSVRLRYRHLTQFEDYQSVEMKLSPKRGQYEASVPGGFIVPQWDLVYFIETMDTKGNGRIYPDLDKETPYVVIPVIR